MGYKGTFKKGNEQYLKEIVLSMIPNEPCGMSSANIAINTGIK